MGNCVGITSTPPPSLPQLQEQPHEHNQTVVREEDYDHHMMNTTSTIYMGTPDLMGSGTKIGSSSLAGNSEVASVGLDPRLLPLLHFFKHLCTRRNDVFEKIIPVHQEAFEDIFKGINDQREDCKRKHSVMQRSNSFGVVESVIRPRLFKVHPIDSSGATSRNGGGRGGKGGGGEGLISH